jgi:hypothetical protein
MAKYVTISAILLSGLLLTACSKNSGNSNTDITPTTTERVNQFLTDKGINLPTGVKRADLSEANSSGGTGVATQDASAGKNNYAVIADLPELNKGTYVAWLKNEAGEILKLGNLKSEKGGMMVDYSTAKDVSTLKQVVVSQEETVGNAPTNVVLEGSF